MVLTKNINVRINNINIKHYIKTYPSIKLNDIITVNVDELSSGSKYKIDVSCDKCGIIKNMMYSSYYRYAILYDKKGIYYCNKCVKSERTKHTMIINHGVEYPLQNKEIKDKFINTNMEKYGVEYPLQNKSVLKKQENTNLKKYGFKYVSLNDNVRKKQTINKIKNLIPKYTDYIFVSYNDENKLIELKCKKNHHFYISRNNLYNRYNYNTNLCTDCNPLNKNISGMEIDMINFIKINYHGLIIDNTKSIIPPFELDIYLPDLKLAFEFNGLYWHNELHKQNDYHKNKTDLCNEKGIQLIHIYEDDWVYKQEIVKSMILNKLNKTENKIFARKCNIKEIHNNNLTKDFIENNHIQGFVGSSIKLGLFYDGELVSLMTFGKKRNFMNSFSSEGEYEMLRFCNKLNTSVIGGASKLFKYFIRNYNPTEVVSYADRSYSNGNLYKQIGFKLIHISKPNYYYIIDRNRKHRFGFRKDILVKQGFDSSKTEHQIMLERKIYRIYNSGNYKFYMSCQRKHRSF
ncbi:MAG: DUF7487 domain-containing protein [bacterium]